MRLIDADKLMRFFTVDTANQTYRFGTIKKQIENAETIQAIPIPDNATNGDVMKAMFPNIEVKHHMAYGLKNGIKVRVYIDEFSVFDLWFPARWWNAPYKKGDKND